MGYLKVKRVLAKYVHRIILKQYPDVLEEKAKHKWKVMTLLLNECGNHIF